MRAILTALGFLTIIPVKIQPKLEDLARSMTFFPLVGLFIGTILVLVNQGVSLLFPHLVANLLVVAILVILTGAFHLDGLADTLDGLYAGKTKEEILEIMRDSRIGVMGVTGVILVLLAKWASLCEMPLAIKNPALLLTPALGRWSMVLAAFMAPYARGGNGLGRPFAGKISLPIFWASGLFTFVTSIVFLGMGGIFLFLLTALMVIGLVEFMKKKIGGMTGDTLGFVCEFVEVITLFAILNCKIGN